NHHLARLEPIHGRADGAAGEPDAAANLVHGTRSLVQEHLQHAEIGQTESLQVRHGESTDRCASTCRPEKARRQVASKTCYWTASGVSLAAEGRALSTPDWIAASSSVVDGPRFGSGATASSGLCALVPGSSASSSVVDGPTFG